MSTECGREIIEDVQAVERLRIFLKKVTPRRFDMWLPDTLVTKRLILRSKRFAERKRVVPELFDPEELRRRAQREARWKSGRIQAVACWFASGHVQQPFAQRPTRALHRMRHGNQRVDG